MRDEGSKDYTGSTDRLIETSGWIDGYEEIEGIAEIGGTTI